MLANTTTNVTSHRDPVIAPSHTAGAKLPACVVTFPMPTKNWSSGMLKTDRNLMQ